MRSPRLHESKRTALLQLCNCMLACDLKNLEDLYNGDVFVDIIRTSFPDFVPAEQPKTTEDSNENKQDDGEMKETSETESVKVATEDTKTPIIEAECTGLEVDTTCIPDEVSPIEKEIEITEENLQNTNVDSVRADEEKILQNYRVIEKFIDEQYFLKSSDIISYVACMEAKELELSKVACFLLSEVAKLCTFLRNDQLSTLALLDSRVQEDLEECFQLFILERESISKSSVERMLCHQAKYKSPSPVTRNSFITPRRSCASKYRISSPTTPSTEDVFTNSPLKSFFESPVFKKEDLMRKEKEIVVTRNILYEEELKAEDLKSEVNELKDKLKKKDDELQKLKETVKEMTESEKIKDEDIKKLIEEKEEATKEFRIAEKILNEENSNLMYVITTLQKEVKDCLNGTCKSSNVLKDFMVMKRDLEREKNNSKNLLSELKTTKEKLKNKSKELHDVNARLQSVTFDYMKNESFYKEKLNEMKVERKDEPNSPGSGEIIGSIIEEENKMLRLKLNTAESKIKELEEKLEKFEMLEKDCIPSHQNPKVLSMPDLVDMSELRETQNIQDLQNEKELPNSLNVCDISSSSENVSKNLFHVCDNSTNTEIITKNSFDGCDISSNSEEASNNLYNRCDILGNSEVVSNNSLTGCDISMSCSVKKVRNAKRRWTEVPFSDPTVKLYCTLWKNLNVGNEDDSGSKKTIGSLTFCEFLNLLKISSINVSERYNLGAIFADKKSDADYLSSVLKGEKSKENVSKVVQDFGVFRELLSCLFIFVDSNTALPTDNFYDWVKSHLENGHRKMNEESLLEKKVSDYAIQLKKKVEEIERLEMNCSIFEGKLELYKVELEKKSKFIEDLESKFKQTEEVAKLFHSKYERCKIRVLSLMESEKENVHLRKKLKKLESDKKNLDVQFEKFNSCIVNKDRQIRYLGSVIDDEKRLNIAKENIITTLKSERDMYLLKVKQLAKTLEDKDSAVISNHRYEVVRKPKNNNLEHVTEQSLPQRSKKEPLNASYMSESFYPDLNSTATRDFNNESTLSGALYSKNGLVGQFVSQDEESFFNLSSLEDIKKVTNDDRLDELKRRNSLYPIHLQSAYPLEVNLTPSANTNLYVKNQEKVEHSETASGKQSSDNPKKRKIDEVEPESKQSNDVPRTPLVKIRRAFRNSESMKKILNFRRNRPSVMKPKP